MCHRCYIFIASALLVVWIASQGKCEEQVLDAKQLQNVWAKIAPAPGTCFRFEYQLRRTIHAEGMNAVNKDALRERAPLPMTEDSTYDAPVELIIRGHSLRWTRQSKGERHTTVSHDGKSTTLHEPLVPTESHRPDAGITKDDPSEVFQLIQFYPITFALSPIGKNTFIEENLGNFEFLGKRQLLGRDCWLVKCGSFQFYFDTREPYLLRRVINKDGATEIDLQVDEYKEINQRWFPALWACSTWFDSKRVETVMYRLVSVSDQAECPDSTFSIELPVGTHVHVSDGSNKEYRYVVMPPSKGRLWQRLVIAGVLVVIIAAVAVWQIRRWRRGLGAAQ